MNKINKTLEFNEKTDKTKLSEQAEETASFMKRTYSRLVSISSKLQTSKQ